jgi:hypothetical protein
MFQIAIWIQPFDYDILKLLIGKVGWMTFKKSSKIGLDYQ